MKKNDLLEEIASKKMPTHIAFILDGNGRWAKNKGLPRTAGHHKGANTLQEIVKECSNLGIKYFTAYVFSTENWSRPESEISFIMKEIKKICKDYQKFIKLNIKVRIIGVRDYLTKDIIEMLDLVTQKTSNCTGMTLLIAFNYGARREIIDCVKKIVNKVNNNEIKIDNLDEKIIEDNLYTKGIPSVDFLIRTSGEIRVSNYLLWQIAYAEMYFTKVYWPDFHAKELYEAIYEYQNRRRRYGGLENE